MMQKLEGEFAEGYNLRKHRSGAFWSDRYHCTLVDSGTYAWNCMKYIDLNMVRARVVTHPSEWQWCGYEELVGVRQRYRLVDLKSVLRWQDGVSLEEFTQEYRRAIEDSIRRRDLERQGVWTESIAVGSEEFVGRISERVRNRIRLERKAISEGVWAVREGPVPYEAD
jgi:putative transposase